MRKATKRIPLVDVAASYLSQKRAIDRAIEKILRSATFILGSEVAQFEEEFTSYLGTKHAVGVASGTDALILSLKALSMKEHDEVIVPANSYPTAFAVLWSGAKIKLADIDLATYNLDTLSVEQTTSKKTKAIVPVHLFGLPCEMNAITALAAKHKLFVIEDAAQAHGATFHGKKVGVFGVTGCFSFYPTKNLGAFGDGGMVVTSNLRVAKSVSMMRMYGEKRRYESVVAGTNSRLDALQAGILRVKLKMLDKNNNRRRAIAGHYKRELRNFDLILPEEKEYTRHVYHIFALRSAHRNQLMLFLQRHGIHTAVHYPIPVHLVKSFSFLNHKRGDFPNAERASRELLSLPCYPELRNSDVERVCSLVKRFFMVYYRNRGS